MLKIKNTTRKFYNKWLYKVSLRIPGVSIFRMCSYESVIEESYATSTNSPNSISSRAKANKVVLSKLAIFFSNWDSTEWSKRIESNTLDLYTNNKQFYDAVLLEFEDNVSVGFQPALDDLEKLENTGTIIASKLPHDQYRYRVFLLPHKIQDTAVKREFTEWCDSQSPRIRISSIVKQWFIDTKWNWDRRYVLVEDQHTLLLLKLRNSEAVGRVYEYVIRDKY